MATTKLLLIWFLLITIKIITKIKNDEKYKNILNQAKIKKFDIEKFIESQRNWVELKEILFWNGIGNEKEKLRVLTEMTENRILDFDSYLEDYIEEFE